MPDEHDNSASGAGAACVFARAGESWGQEAFLKASNPESGDTLGRSVAISDGTVIVGANAADSAATGVNGFENNNCEWQSGAAYVLSGLGWRGLGELICLGAANSTGESGRLIGSGSSAVSDRSFRIEASCCPLNAIGRVLVTRSSDLPVGFVHVGAGALCVNDRRIGRFPLLSTDAAGAAAQTVDLDAVPNGTGSNAVFAGDTYFFQLWYLDRVADGPTTNLTDAVTVTFE